MYTKCNEKELSAKLINRILDLSHAAKRELTYVVEKLINKDK